MLFSVAGHLSLPTQDTWKDASLEPDGHPWLEDGPVLTGTEPPGPAETVGAFVETLATTDDLAYFVDFAWSDRVDIVGRFEAPEIFEAFAQDLVVSLYALGAAGAVGDVLLAAGDEGFGWRVRVGEDPSIEPLEGEALFVAAAPYSRAFMIGHRVGDRRTTEPETPPSVLVAAERNLHLGADDPPARREAWTRLVAIDAADALAVAARQGLPAADNAPLAELLDPDGWTRARDRRDPELRVAAVAVLAAHGDDQARPLARQLVDDPSPYVRGAARLALAIVGDPADVETILKTPPLQSSELLAAVAAVTRLSGAAVDDTIRDRWHTGVTAVEAVGDIDTEAGMQAIWELGFWTDVALARGQAGFDAMLLKLFDETKVPQLRAMAFSGLQQCGGPVVESATERLQYFSFGMGLALNQDDERRRELLGITGDKDSGGILRFSKLRGETLQILLDEGFVDPQARQNEAPCTLEFFELMQAHPAIEAGGYAVSASRADYRIHLDGIECDLDDIDEDSRDEVREVFEAWSESATQVELEDDYLSLWWT